jgi:ATP-dependent DNA helicase PIF1
MTNKLDTMEFYERGKGDVVTPLKYVCGAAGTGKTFNVKQAIAADPRYGLLSATTGIAAINLGAITINSLLKYYDTSSLAEAFMNGWVQQRLLKLAKDGYKWLIIDEVSMMAAEQLDIIYQSTKQVNEMLAEMGKAPIGIYLTGDFAQLPPIKSKWAFEAECWPLFDSATERLTKVWRQSDAKFLDAINHIRAGRGMVGATLLAQLGVEFSKVTDQRFNGTTIIAKNDAVDNFNWLCLSKVPGVPYIVKSDRWMMTGRRMPKDWDNIPGELKLKDNALVMILANDTSPTGEFSYCNGDCGHIVKYDDKSGKFTVRLIRNLAEVEISRIQRKETQREPPDEILMANPDVAEDDLRDMYGDYQPNQPRWDSEHGREGAWVTGAVTFYPLRLAYASTVHKTQGLTLDRIQVDLNQNFMSAPSMCYVALSRCKSPQGLRIVGSPALLGSRVKVDAAVMKWL